MAAVSAKRTRPQVIMTLAPEEIALLDAQAEARGMTRSRWVAELSREEAKRAAKREN